MPDIVLTSDTMGLIATFETVTGAQVRDCMETPDKVVFVIGPGQVGKAVGKGGHNISRLKDLFKKNVQIVEYSDNPEQFVKNVFRNYEPSKVEIEQRGNVVHATVTVNPTMKARAIGKEGKNLKIARDLINRHHRIESVNVA